MPVHPTIEDLALRLLLTVVAGFLIGFNRGGHGRAAGLRTTLLVCLAASVSMIQVNLLLPLAGKTSDSFNTLDLMRLPLGILTGVGFIGAGAILRRGSRVKGVTTAATLWMVTVIGLCFGGGQIWLGLAALILGWLVLWGLKYYEAVMRRERHATLILIDEGDHVPEARMIDALKAEGFSTDRRGLELKEQGRVRLLTLRLSWKSLGRDLGRSDFIDRLPGRAQMTEIRWQPDEEGQD
jgi:putative Mg2+ transporter-C (MgtC) family protein